MRDGSGCRRQTNDEIAAESSKIDVVDEMKDSTTATAPSGLEIASTRCQTPLEMRGCTIEGCESRQIHRTPCKQGRRAFSDFSDFLIFFAPLANSLQSAVVWTNHDIQDKWPRMEAFKFWDRLQNFMDDMMNNGRPADAEPRRHVQWWWSCFNYFVSSSYFRP